MNRTCQRCGDYRELMFIGTAPNRSGIMSDYYHCRKCRRYSFYKHEEIMETEPKAVTALKEFLSKTWLPFDYRLRWLKKMKVDIESEIERIESIQTERGG